MTRDGIEYDLTISPYMYAYNNLTFYFSSVMHLRKFMTAVQEYETGERQYLLRLNKRNNLNLEFTDLRVVLIELYQRLESRGYYIEVDGVGYTCLKIKLDPVLIGLKSAPAILPEPSDGTISN